VMPAGVAAHLADAGRLEELSALGIRTAREQVDWEAFRSRIDRALARPRPEHPGRDAFRVLGEAAGASRPAATEPEAVNRERAGERPRAERRSRRRRDGAPRIGLWGTFDLENFGDMVLARVTRAELLRRVPDATVRVFAPLGYPG